MKLTVMLCVPEGGAINLNISTALRWLVSMTDPIRVRAVLPYVTPVTLLYGMGANALVDTPTIKIRFEPVPTE